MDTLADPGLIEVEAMRPPQARGLVLHVYLGGNFDEILVGTVQGPVWGPHQDAFGGHHCRQVSGGHPGGWGGGLTEVEKSIEGSWATKEEEPTANQNNQKKGGATPVKSDGDSVEKYAVPAGQSFPPLGP